ncbi:MAG: DUF2203 domain-containing protein [Clostridia bacterium]|nr:DUF2203 domain-containing protein [Clostridia bacterium]
MRYFTVEEANALLPKLEELLRHLKAIQEEARQRVEEIERIKAVGYGPDGRLIMAYDYRLNREALDRLVVEANRLIESINGMGCQLKDIDRGLVDFPARLNGETVLLCWQSGEPSVAYYHLPSEGFAGRRPIQGAW